MDDDLEIGKASGRGSAWMATFADMMTLLLCFFILMLSFSNIDIIKFRTALGSAAEALGVQRERDGQFEALATSPLQLFEHEASGPRQDRALLEELHDAIVTEGFEEAVGAEIDGRGVIVRMDGQVLYEPGDAVLRPESESMLARIAGVIHGTEHRVMIEGHTDNVPIQTARYPSNWELSTARAISAMRVIVEHGVDTARVGVAGYSSLRPLESNDTPAQRAANRRVEFVFIRTRAHESEEEPQQPAQAAGVTSSPQSESLSARRP